MPIDKPDETKATDMAVTNDWPDDMPITEAELELFERHMLDIITAMVQHD